MKRLQQLAAVGVLVGATVLAGKANAQMPQAPAYLHAITDMRLARAYLLHDNRPEFDRQKRHAIDEITIAIKEIKDASIDDGKDINYAPPTDAHGMASGPYHEALRLLNKAHQDCTDGIDMPNSENLKFRALKHIDEAKDTIDHMTREAHAF